jgi:hypothetical protein
MSLDMYTMDLEEFSKDGCMYTKVPSFPVKTMNEITLLPFRWHSFKYRVTTYGST